MFFQGSIILLAIRLFFYLPIMAQAGQEKTLPAYSFSLLPPNPVISWLAPGMVFNIPLTTVHHGMVPQPVYRVMHRCLHWLLAEQNILRALFRAVREAPVFSPQ